MNPLQRLQEKAGIEPDGIFGKNTFKHCSKVLGIDKHSKAVHFWAQVGHETGNFKHFEENLNYSSDALLRVFGRYFKDREEANNYAREPEKIASKVYANRMGNGDEESMDGWKYRGRGALQLTGKNNYKSFSDYLGVDVIKNPNLVVDKYAFESAMFFFDSNNLWQICLGGLDEKTIKKLTKRINGGYNGIEHRIELTNKYATYNL